MSSTAVPSPEDIAQDATWLVQAIDPASRMVRLIAMDREAYRAASFLDDRMLQAPQDVRFVSWPAIAEAAGHVSRTDARWIFHIGHVGSTLIARLLGELPGVLSVREPRFLRDIALAADRQALTAAAPSIFSRTFAEDETALVKATSFVSEIAPELVPAGGRALFMHASAPNYIAAILAGDASRQELQALATIRVGRAASRVTGLDRQSRTDAHLAAAAWACEMTALEAAADTMDDRKIGWLDFDEALEDLPATLGRVAHAFGFGAPDALVRDIASGPLTRRYSKALEYDYSADLRRDVIAEAARQHAADIRDALAMLEDAAQESPLLARALARSNRGL